MTTEIKGKKGKVEINVYGDVDIIDEKSNSQYYVNNHGQESHNNFKFGSGSGKDVIYTPNANDSITFTEENLLDVTFTNSGKDDDLVIKKHKDTITLSDYFISDSKLNNIATPSSASTITANWIVIDGKGNINGIQNKNYASYITGSSGKDNITAGLGENQIKAGKGDDTITFKNKKLAEIGEFNRVGMVKGDGNDTITLNFDGGDVTEGKLEGLPQFYFDTDVNFSYAKENNDLIIKASHDQKGNSAETVKIKDYFSNTDYNIKTLVDNGIALNKGFENITSTLNLSNEIKTAEHIIINGISAKEFYNDNKQKSDLYIYQGSIYNDSVTGSTKVDEIHVYGGNNNITTGMSGGTIVTSLNTGNDNYTVSNISSGTLIYDDGGEDVMQINGVSKNDLHLYADTTAVLGYMNTACINGIKNIKSDTDYNFAKTLKGVIDNNGGIEHVYVADAKGMNVKQINNTDIVNVANDLRTDVTAHLNYLKDIAGLNYATAFETLHVNTKNMNKLQKNVLTSVQKELTELYNTSYIGSSDANSYTLKKGNHYIGSGAGNDTFKFSGVLGYEDAIERVNHQTKIYSSLSEHETDNIEFSNYSFEKGNLTSNFNFDDNSLVFNTYDTDKAGIDYKNTIYYYNNDILNANDKNVFVKDKSRKYSVVATTNEYNSNWLNNESKINHLAFIKSKDDAYINSNKGYNYITLTKADGVDAGHRTAFSYYYNGGHDIIKSSSEFCDDEYMINYTSNADVRITDAGGTDSIDISSSSSKFKVDSLRMMLNVEYDADKAKYVTGSYSLVSTSNLTKSNVTFVDDEFVSKKGVTVNGDIETVKIAKTAVNMTTWTNYISEQVESFLSANKYLSTAQVFENGSSQDIKTLINIYNKSYSEIPQP